VSQPPLALCFGVHNHQPVGNFEHVLEAAEAQAYRPFLECLRGRPEVRLTTHWTGGLLEWMREHAPQTFDLLSLLVGRGQVELLTGGFYEPILAVLPDHDKVGQIQRLTEFIVSHFGVRPRGMWLAERVWEPHLPPALREAGVEYVLVDDSHFGLAGVDPDVLGGYYLTEDQGVTIGIFPINQRLRYLIPFAEVEASVEYLERRRGQVTALTIADDGEKFGVWPGTYRHVYEEGWLNRFFDRLLALPWLRLTTFGNRPRAGSICPPRPTARWVSGHCRLRRQVSWSARSTTWPRWRRASAGSCSCVAASGAPFSSSTPRSPIRTGRCCVCRRRSSEPRRNAPTARWGRHAPRCGGDRRTMPTGTAFSAAATCRICGGP
jgi:hypothetical protein